MLLGDLRSFHIYQEVAVGNNLNLIKEKIFRLEFG